MITNLQIKRAQACRCLLRHPDYSQFLLPQLLKGPHPLWRLLKFAPSAPP